MQWEVVIGFETHVQLSTKSKIFSGASTQFGAEPNTQASPVDLALPGVLPVLNRAAVEKAIQFGLAVNGKIAPISIFARKNYFYPDLPKGYQISQFELPIVQGGTVHFAFEYDGKTEVRSVQLTRAHLEEDAGKSLHEDYHGMSGIDLNRAGTPLLEIVTEPVMRSALEAVAYAKALHSLVTWLGICDGNMQEGSFRCDANVSIRPLGQTEFGTRCEIKNLNSFRFLEDAINVEVRRQIELIEDGGRVVQETRLYDPDTKQTRSMRSKEDSQDYRYFPDPDLLPLAVNQEWINQVKSGMPELPDTMRARLVSQFGLSEYDAMLLTRSKDIASYCDGVLRVVKNEADSHTKRFANFMIGSVIPLIDRDVSISLENLPSANHWARIFKRMDDGTISNKIALEVAKFIILDESSEDPAGDRVDAIIDTQGLKQISDPNALEKMIDEVLAANAKSVEEYRAGKEKAFNALVGQAMKATKGKANPAQVNALLLAKLK